RHLICVGKRQNKLGAGAALAMYYENIPFGHVSQRGWLAACCCQARAKLEGQRTNIRLGSVRLAESAL
ncbi:hypothetical protein, partial [Serratia marcescens]|uniref:hypothetical protein n=1 Tax=Serratia marcescens TaxID=615 RepID=UPI0028146A65